jgi:hypothetical protein
MCHPFVTQMQNESKSGDGSQHTKEFSRNHTL